MLKTFLPAALLLLAAQQPPAPKPGFKSGVTVVEVDVVVTDKSGRPVRGLRREDFEISEDGSPVEIATFSAVDVPEAPRHSVIPPADRSGSAFASNESADDGRVMLIVLDDVQVSFTSGRMATVKSIARRAVERLGPADLAGGHDHQRAAWRSGGVHDGQVAAPGRDRAVRASRRARTSRNRHRDRQRRARTPTRPTRRSENDLGNGGIEHRGAGAGDDPAPAEGRALHQPGLSRHARGDHQESHNRRRVGRPSRNSY